MNDDLLIFKNEVTPDDIRRAMRQWSTGVTIVSSVYDGFQHAMTVNSFTSISLDPPVILVSLNRAARTVRLVEKSGVFGVTILEESQKAISERFAGFIAEDSDRFAGLETFTLVTGAPLISKGLAYLDCQVFQSLDVGGNALFLGKIVGLGLAQTGRPLAYYNQDYRSIKFE